MAYEQSTTSITQATATMAVATDTYSGSSLLTTASTDNVVCNGTLNNLASGSNLKISKITYSVKGQFGTIAANSYLDLLLIPSGETQFTADTKVNKSTVIAAVKNCGGYVLLKDYSIGYVSGTGSSATTKTISLTSSSKTISEFNSVSIKAGSYKVWYIIHTEATARTETLTTSSVNPICSINSLTASMTLSSVIINTEALEKGTQIFTNGLGYKESAGNYAVVMTPSSDNTGLTVSIKSSSGTSSTTVNMDCKGCKIIASGSSSAATLSVANGNIYGQLNGNTAYPLFGIKYAASLTTGGSVSVRYNPYNISLSYVGSGSTGQTYYMAYSSNISLSNSVIMVTPQALIATDTATKNVVSTNVYVSGSTYLRLYSETAAGNETKTPAYLVII